MFGWETHQKNIKFRDTLLLLMAGRIPQGLFTQRITKATKALKTCHPEFVQICIAASYNGKCLFQALSFFVIHYRQTVNYQIIEAQIDMDNDNLGISEKVIIFVAAKR